jgi:hypothetical protein
MRLPNVPFLSAAALEASFNGQRQAGEAGLTLPSAGRLEGKGTILEFLGIGARIRSEIAPCAVFGVSPRRQVFVADFASN